MGKKAQAFPNTRDSGIVRMSPPKIVKPKPKQEQSIAQDKKSVHGHNVAASFQQLLVNIFKDAFPHVLGSEDLQKVIQDVKGALYERDFRRAFGTTQCLNVYCVRWSPSRALCYLSILVDIRTHLRYVLPSLGFDEPNPDITYNDSPNSTPVVMCVGGGAAEAVAFGGFIRYSKLAFQAHNENPECEAGNSSVSVPALTSSRPILSLNLVDCAQWDSVVAQLNQCMIEPPALSKYATSTARDANHPLLNSTDINISFLQHDILRMDSEQIANLIGLTPILVTLLFTLNELYANSVSKTTALLLNLTMAVKSGSILLVVDSPGSYSETSIGAETKKYPNHWLLDYCLLTRATNGPKDSSAVWLKLINEHSKWFRVPENISYPIPLENMRYQIHLYKRL